EFTFDDIVRELEKPGRDPRDPFKVFAFRDDIFEVKDLKEGMICPGIVTNVTNFGAFVDIGVHQDGLVHISELSTKFVDDPRKVVNPGDQVTIRVLGVDMEKTQISLSMILEADAPRERAPRAEAGRGGGRGAKREAPAAPAPTPTPGPRVGGPQPRAAGDSARDSGSRPTPRGPGPIQPAGSGGSGGLGRESGGRVAHIGSNSGGPRGQGGGPRGGQPFNNPFAALLNNDSKSNQKR
ncbi:MAG: S1 RNA-binding domain-containing protein, partial [Bdellovibrionales bacterium]|nr:S1 RNA-binding domain-containing protein [Bdellovibrionales bacterium]